MNRRSIWVYGCAALALVWAAAAAAIAYSRAQVVTAETVREYLGAHSLSGKGEAQRREIIEGLARQVNQLGFEERQKFRFEKNLRSFYLEMSDAERSLYLDRTLSKGMQQMMEAFNKSPPERRRRLVENAVKEIRRAQGEARREDVERALADPNIQRIMDEGFKSFLRDADASAKLDLQPVIEQIQHIVQGAR